MKTRKLIVLLCLSAFLSSCTNDSEDDLIEQQNDDDGVDLTITYNQDIRPIIQNNCISCHASPPQNGAPFALINYDQVNQRANAIFNAMDKPNGAAAAMPPSGRLPQATINLLQEWIADGKPEN